MPAEAITKLVKREDEEEEGERLYLRSKKKFDGFAKFTSLRVHLGPV